MRPFGSSREENDIRTKRPFLPAASLSARPEKEGEGGGAGNCIWIALSLDVDVRHPFFAEQLEFA